MTGRIVSFGSYTFPSEQHQFTTNFNSRVPNTVRLPGVSGGFDEYGSSPAPVEVGRVTLDFTLVSTTPEGMTVLRDAVNKLGDIGKVQLFMQPSDPVLSQRWCLARVRSISMPESASELLSQKVNIVWEVSDPFWYIPGNQKLYDGTYTYNGAITWDDSASGFNSITGSGSFTVSPAGSALTLGRVVTKVVSATGLSQLTVRRILNGAAVDEMTYQGALVTNDVIEFDPRKQWVLVNGVDKFSKFSFKHPDWLRLLPGTNSIQVILDDSAAQVSVAIRYYERYV